MKYFKRKDGTVFGKQNPSKEQMEAYKKDDCVVCDKDGKSVKKTKKVYREVHRSE
jgi:hypothetical protein